MLKKKEERTEVTCLRLTEGDIKSTHIIVKESKTDASSIIRGLFRLGLAVYQKESQTDKSEALLRLLRIGSLNN